MVRDIDRVCFIGAGYVGGPIAAVLALYNPSVRFDVVDRDTARIKAWKSCRLPIHEPDLDNVVRVARDGAEVVATFPLDPSALKICNTISGPSPRQPNLFFSDDISNNIHKADMVFITVNTPTKTSGSGSGFATDMSTFDWCINNLARHARPGTIIVEKSTVPCGTAESILDKLRVQRCGVCFEVISNPEFSSEGSAIKDLLQPHRIVIGSSATSSGQAAARQLARLYSWVPFDRIVTSDCWSSELSKLVANAMLAQRISSMNSISAICEKTDANIDEVAKAVGLDARIGSEFLQSGLGYGGSCFRKDIASLAYIADALGLHDVAHYWIQVNTMNEAQKSRFTDRVIRSLDNVLAGKKIAILGFAFKKNTGDVRDSLALDVIKTLLQERPAELAVYDPCCRTCDIVSQIMDNVVDDAASAQHIIKVYTSPYLACAKADAVLVLTDCDQFFLVDHDAQSDSELQEHQSLSFDNSRCSYAESLDAESHRQFAVKTLESIMVYQLKIQRSCASFDSCPKCQISISPQASSLHSFISTENVSNAVHTPMTARVDWATIIGSANQPVRIFDGRHVFKHGQIESFAAGLGQTVILESIGVRSKELR